MELLKIKIVYLNRVVIQKKKIQQNIHEDITLKNILPTENKKCNAFQSATITMFLS